METACQKPARPWSALPREGRKPQWVRCESGGAMRQRRNGRAGGGQARVGAGRRRCREGGRPGNHLAGRLTRQMMPPWTSGPLKRLIASRGLCLIPPGPTDSTGDGVRWATFLSLFLRFLLPCQRKLTEEGGGRQRSWAGHPVTQAQVIFIDIHGADSKRSPWQDGPGMVPWGLQPALPPSP